MLKYENVDVIEFLRSVMEKNTRAYKDDFEYDVKKITDAAKSLQSDDKWLLWLSRPAGTECYFEDSVYMRGDSCFIRWQYYADATNTGYSADLYKAYAVVIIELDNNNRVIGNVYKLDYAKHAIEVNNLAEIVEHVDIMYFDGYTECIKWSDFQFDTDQTPSKHGGVLHIDYCTKNGTINEVVEFVRREREKKCTLSQRRSKAS